MNHYPHLSLKEHSSSKYPPRTYHNATTSDVTVAFAVDLTTAGEKLTRKAAGEEKYIGFELRDDTEAIDLARKLYKKMKSQNAKVLNIAGNGIYTLSKHGCEQDFINLFVYNVIAKVHEYHPIEKIITGGQTGVDMAGAIAGVALNIPVEVTFPNGYLQRFTHEDVVQTQEDILKQIDHSIYVLNQTINPSKTKKHTP